jgi:hypothetical protein
MPDKRKPKSGAGTLAKEARRRRSSDGERGGQDDDAFAEATHRVVEDEIRKGDATSTPEPDQKGEPGSSV